MKKECVVLYESESIVSVTDILNEWKSVRISVPRRENWFWVAKVSEYKSSNNYNRDYLDCMEEDGDFYLNTSELMVGDIITLRILERDSSKYAIERKAHFIVENINDRGIHVKAYDTLFKAIKDDFRREHNNISMNTLKKAV